MGQNIYNIIRSVGHSCPVAIDRDDSPALGKQPDPSDPSGPVITTLDEADLSLVDVMIDFSSPAGTLKHIEACAGAGKGIVVGTTGFSPEEKAALESYGDHIPLFLSPNMSMGVPILYRLVEIAAKALDRSYDIEVYEAHHRHKKDAPSGTALWLIEAARAMEGMKDAPLKPDRYGITGERSDEEIGVQVVRGGDIVGDHTVMFAGPGERIELTHRATSRENFARGAVKAAGYIYDKEPGIYTMFDVLGI
jgi:4-hydroxy-tetrahydrodipicolinate reductase